MLRTSIIALLLIFNLTSYGQEADTLFATRKGNNWAIKYVVKPGEGIHMLAQRFCMSDGILEYENEYDVIKKLIPGAVISIPVTVDNYFVTKPSILENSNVRELYYHVAAKEDIGMISTYAGVTKSTMRSWNGLKGNTLTIGQVLFIGWIKMISKDSSNPASFTMYPPVKRASAPRDTIKVRNLGGLDTVYNSQTNNGMNVLTEKGTAVFFDKTGKNNVYFAFHNATARGSVIKVFNPGTGKSIYVKVLGPIPNTKAYAGSIIGICNAAKEALGVTDNKAWCELSYSPN
jgi:hypothetical protein